jgi:beta-glucanase (GH16 family)
MKVLSFLLFTASTIFPYAPKSQTSWNLIWSDEFSGNSLDLNHWSYEFGGGGWGNNELVYYTNHPDNISVSSGTLKIVATRENPGPMEYQSARIISKDKFSFQYGKVEARMRLPLGQGLWPAFWMMGQNIDQVDWPSCGEIDIMEHVNSEPLIHGTVHWNHGGHTSIGDTHGVDVSEYHIYGAIWDEESIDFYVDGVIYFSFPLVSGNQSANTFDQPVFLLLNMAIGGNFPGSPDATTVFPAQMEVDYVRVFQNEPNLEVETSDHPNLQLFPNPCGDKINVQSSGSGPVKFILLDLLGRSVYEETMTTPFFSVNLSLIPSGLYVVVLRSENSRIEKRLSIQR